MPCRIQVCPPECYLFTGLSKVFIVFAEVVAQQKCMIHGDVDAKLTITKYLQMIAKVRFTEVVVYALPYNWRVFPPESYLLLLNNTFLSILVYGFILNFSLFLLT